ncbi:hypothetical protein ACFYKX_15800 [Cytobacillus sp. FJAT-54145]|uniref:YojE n=1 Tax=Cytobacillus spartinae TaxID=3299023 RepID=A0ABW6KD08_9BACI
MTDYNYLLMQYRTLWNNRLLMDENDSEQILKEAIMRELKDENSHPRIRKPLHEKFFLGTKRITDSSLAPEDKLALIQLHIELLEKIKIDGQ